MTDLELEEAVSAAVAAGERCSKYTMSAMDVDRRLEAARYTRMEFNWELAIENAKRSYAADNGLDPANVHVMVINVDHNGSFWN